MEKGQIVKALRGRDKGNFLVVLSAEAPFVTLCDGKRRPLEHPKRKKAFHTAATSCVLGEESLCTNRQIRRALRAFAEATME